MKKILFICTVAILAFACSGPSPKISGSIAGASNAKITLTRIGAQTLSLIDTLRTNDKGYFSYKIKQKKKTFEPFFLSIMVDSTQLATLLVDKAGSITFESDMSTRKTNVEGSEGSVLLQELDAMMAKSAHQFDSLLLILQNYEGQPDYQDMYTKINYDLGDVYVKYRRASLRFIMSNVKSLASVSALYQRFPNGLSVYADKNDFTYFQVVHDSLSTVYPNSEYVIGLKEEYERRRNNLEMNARLEQAESLSFPEITLPDVNAKLVKLSSLAGKVFLLHFWLSSDPKQRIDNKDMEEIYHKYRAKGFEIYQVAVDVDKPAWARTVANQAIPWISVCDGFGTISTAVTYYNVTQIPSSFLFDKEGNIVAKGLSLEQLDARLAKLCAN